MEKIELKGISDGRTVVNAQTEEEARAILDIADAHGYTWVNASKYSDKRTRWELRKEETCYFFTEGLMHGRKYFENEGFKIISAQEFIDLNS